MSSTSSGTGAAANFRSAAPGGGGLSRRSYRAWRISPETRVTSCSSIVPRAASNAPPHAGPKPIPNVWPNQFTHAASSAAVWISMGSFSPCGSGEKIQALSRCCHDVAGGAGATPDDRPSLDARSRIRRVAWCDARGVRASSRGVDGDEIAKLGEGEQTNSAIATFVCTILFAMTAHASRSVMWRCFPRTISTTSIQWSRATSISTRCARWNCTAA